MGYQHWGFQQKSQQLKVPGLTAPKGYHKDSFCFAGLNVAQASSYQAKCGKSVIIKLALIYRECHSFGSLDNIVICVRVLLT